MNIINYEHVDALVEIDEIVNGIESACICILNFEKMCRYIQHFFLRIKFLNF